MVFKNKLNGFGESALFPVIACLGICFYLVLPNLINLYKAGLIIPSISMAMIVVALSLWMASNLFADFLSLLIFVLVAIAWHYSSHQLIDSINISDTELLQNKDFLSLIIISTYIFIHTLILTMIDFFDNAQE